MNDEVPVPTHRNATRLGIEVMIGNLNLPKTPVMALHEMKNTQSSKLCLVGFFPVAVSSEDEDCKFENISRVSSLPVNIDR